LHDRPAAYGAELPMQLQTNYAGSCPIPDLHYKPEDPPDGVENGSGACDMLLDSSGHKASGQLNPHSSDEAAILSELDTVRD
jgi:hypothetical protein